MFKLRFNNKEEVVFERLTYTAELIEEAIKVLQGEMDQVRKGNYDQIPSHLVKIKMLHEKAEMLREEILSTLYGEAFLPDFKESMVMLTQALFNTLSAVKDASRALGSRKIDKKCVSILSEMLNTYLALVSEAAAKTHELTRYLNNDMEAALKIGREIQAMEREGDDIKDSLLQRLYEIEKEVDIISILQMKDIILFIDDILDSLEEATLSVEIFYATLKS
jgi:predicted phosphate transport protein (TIGR00153 family)